VLEPVDVRAVQLGPALVTPNDDRLLWQLVKTQVQCADAQLHEVDARLLRTHLAMEVVAVVMHRQIRAAHPVHTLLLPHMRYAMVINTAARHDLLAAGGPTECALGSYPPESVAGTPAVAHPLVHFNRRLYEVSARIRARNAALPVPFGYLDPMRIAARIDA
jgi:hypothetical protein